MIKLFYIIIMKKVKFGNNKIELVISMADNTKVLIFLRSKGASIRIPAYLRCYVTLGIVNESFSTGNISQLPFSQLKVALNCQTKFCSDRTSRLVRL